MSDQETKPRREKPRHPSVPVDAVIQKQAMELLGVKSPYRMDLLVKACLAEGASDVIVPEGNAYKHGKWYPADLLQAMAIKNAERPPNPPTNWRSTDELSEIIGLDYNATRAITWQVMADPRMKDHFGLFTSGNGSTTFFFSEDAAEVIRRRAAQQTDSARAPRVRERIRPSPLPPAADAESLLPQERPFVASADKDLMAALTSVETSIVPLKTAIGQITNRTIQQNLTGELKRVENLAKTYRHDVTVLSAAEMTPRIVGLQHIILRLTKELQKMDILEDATEDY